MESLYTLYKIIICIYFGIFTSINYQILFSFQKRLLFIKTILFFLIIAIFFINITNKYQINIFHTYIIFYILGILLSHKFLSKYISKLIKELKNNIVLLKPIIIKITKLLLLPSFYQHLKNIIKQYQFYRKNPHLKPKSIYELY